MLALALALLAAPPVPRWELALQPGYAWTHPGSIAEGFRYGYSSTTDFGAGPSLGLSVHYARGKHLGVRLATAAAPLHDATHVGCYDRLFTGQPDCFAWEPRPRFRWFDAHLDVVGRTRVGDVEPYAALGIGGALISRPPDGVAAHARWTWVASAGFVAHRGHSGLGLEATMARMRNPPLGVAIPLTHFTVTLRVSRSFACRAD